MAIRIAMAIAMVVATAMVIVATGGRNEDHGHVHADGGDEDGGDFDNDIV